MGGLRIAYYDLVEKEGICRTCKKELPKRKIVKLWKIAYLGYYLNIKEDFISIFSEPEYFCSVSCLKKREVFSKHFVYEKCPF